MVDNIFEDALMEDQSVRDKDDKRHIIIYILCAMFFGSVIFNVFVRSNEEFKAGIRTEMRDSYPVLGGAAWNETKSRADSWYKFIMVKSGFEHYLDYTLAEKDKWYDRSDFTKFQKLTIKIVDNIKFTIFQTIYRTSIFVYWLHLCLPFFLALIADGYFERKIRRYQIGGITTKRSRLILQGVIFMLSMIFTYFVVPLEMTNIFLIVPPLVIIFVAIAMRQIIAEYQKGI